MVVAVQNQQIMSSKLSYIAAAFTLLEMMIVLLIMGIVVGIALFSFGSLGSRQQLQGMRTGLSATLVFARKQALLQDAPIAVYLTKHGYCLQRSADSGQWQNWSFNALACQSHHRVHLTMHDDGQDVKHSFIALPQRLLFMPDGMLLHAGKPLLIKLQSSKNSYYVKLTAAAEVVRCS